ncbi:MAG: GntR family transcriptional regulator [Lachnospiraceae bacterium]
MLTLNYRDAKPIYIQIQEGLKKLIISGALEKNEKLPSVRELAGSLAINPNTIQRAYRELEAEGYLYSVSGKGTFVSPDIQVDEDKKKELLEQFDETVEELFYLSVSKKSLQERLEELDKRREQK